MDDDTEERCAYQYHIDIFSRSFAVELALLAEEVLKVIKVTDRKSILYLFHYVIT